MSTKFSAGIICWMLVLFLGSMVVTTKAFSYSTQSIHYYPSPRTGMIMNTIKSKRKSRRHYFLSMSYLSNDETMDAIPSNITTTTTTTTTTELNSEYRPEEIVSVSNSRTSREYMAAMGTSPRRIFLSLLSATVIALAGNLLGITSQLLTFLPEDIVEVIGLDTYFPRGSFKRFKGPLYTFVYPKEWVADTFLALAKAQRQAKSLDYRMTRTTETATLPDQAFGPPSRLNQRGVSEEGDTNVSVVLSSVPPGFSLSKSLGSSSPTTAAAAETFTRLLAPEGSGRTVTLLQAEEKQDGNHPHVYEFDYIVDRGSRGPPLRAISVIAVTTTTQQQQQQQPQNTLLTLTVVAPLKRWKEDDILVEKFRKIASSFHVVEENKDNR